jgi:aspartyl-tRNA(Asn)/glutamyl-tRNA(Gln) amidotransferase subunit B
MSNDTSEYKLTVGLEIHAELATKSKMWCGCKNDPDEVRPNVNICPVCMAHPGTLPVINKEAVRQVLRMGTAAGGKLALDFTEFDRKNYFYPDIPKGYQLSQYKFPLVSGGEICGVKLTRIHLEEDTGTSVHDRGSENDQYSLVNYNRAGVPLMELVTEPVIHSAKEASDFAKELQLLLQYIGAGEANLEKGEMRVEANISISKTDIFGTKVEVKNLNSFKAVEKAIEYEVKRHQALLEKGEVIIQETRGWDENKGVTFSQRKKENAHDYRYFPDPDLPKLKLSLLPEFSQEILKKSLPELPWQKRERFINEYKLNPQHAEFFVSDTTASEYFDSITKSILEKNKEDKKTELIQLASNYVAVDLAGISKKPDFVRFPSADQIAELVILINENKVSSRGAKDILNLMATEKEMGNEKTPEQIAEANGWILKNDPEALKKTLQEIITVNPQVVADYKAGKIVALQFLVGQGMKATKGSVGPDVVKVTILELLA